MAELKRWNDDDWENLVLAIEDGQCTPFLGAGASVLPGGKKTAKQWALASGYPFRDVDNLPRVAQYMVAAKKSPKRKLKDIYEETAPPDFTRENEIHRVVADLDLPIYITTNYDDYMFRALERQPHKKPVRRICPWNLAERRSVPEEIIAAPTPAEPLVYHLHGSFKDLNSMVLTEDDYLDFLIALAEERELIPAQVRAAFSNSALLFLGYSLEDLNFKVIFRRMARFMRNTPETRHVSVQLKPEGENPTEEEIAMAERQCEYLQERYTLQNVTVYWGTCEEFADELQQRRKKVAA